jgi:aminoglycoside 3'-phosphotransferase II
MIPPAIAALIERATPQPVHIGKSGASVFRLDGPATPLFFKAAPLDELVAEVDRLRWLKGRAAVPDVVAFEQDDGVGYLLMTGLPGVNGVDAGHDQPEVVTVSLASALRRLHTQAIEDCTFDQTVAVQIERARQRLHAGLVDETDFDEERLGRAASELFRELEAWRPPDEGRVLTHGDPCLPNVIFDGKRFAGFIDCGRAGLADPYQDLALAARSIESNLGREWLPVFFRAYGLAAPDERKLAFYRLLDEFF